MVIDHNNRISKCVCLLTFCPFRLLGNLAYDVAIIVLKDEIVPGNNIKIARLPDKNAPCPKGRRLVVSGWGLDVSRFLIRSQDSLWAVSLECLDDSSCPLMNIHSPNDTMLCAGDPKNLLNSDCGGDSGGMFYHYLKFLVPMIF